MNTKTTSAEDAINLDSDFDFVEDQYFDCFDLRDMNRQNYKRNEIIFELTKINNLCRKEKIKELIKEESEKCDELRKKYLENYAQMVKVKHLLKTKDELAEDELSYLQGKIQEMKQEEKSCDELKDKVYENSILLKKKLRELKSLINKSHTKEEVDEILDKIEENECAKKNMIKEILYDDSAY